MPIAINLEYNCSYIQRRLVLSVGRLSLATLPSSAPARLSNGTLWDAMGRNIKISVPTPAERANPAKTWVLQYEERRQENLGNLLEMFVPVVPGILSRWHSAGVS